VLLLLPRFRFRLLHRSFDTDLCPTLSDSFPSICDICIVLLHISPHLLYVDVTELNVLSLEFINSFVHPFVHSFICLFIRPFIHSFVHSFVRCSMLTFRAVASCCWTCRRA